MEESLLLLYQVQRCLLRRWRHPRRRWWHSRRRWLHTRRWWHAGRRWHTRSKRRRWHARRWCAHHETRLRSTHPAHGSRKSRGGTRSWPRRCWWCASSDGARDALSGGHASRGHDGRVYRRGRSFDGQVDNLDASHEHESKHAPN